MKDCLDFILKLGGVAFIILFVMIFGTLLCEWLRDTISHLKWKWKYKHRFDKKPTAMCYCKDCRYYNLDQGCCTDGHANIQFRLADSHFCAFASPRKHDPEKEKKK